MKIKKVEVRDLKAVKEQDIDFNGSSIIVTGGNNKGKSSVLNGLIDRLRGEKPEMIVREGEKNGSYNMELTDGSLIEWKFTEKSEKFSFTTKDGLVIKSGVISAIGERYFGTKFDVDKFLVASDKQKYKMLSKTIGIDLDEIDERYDTAYADRTEKNRALKTLRENSVKKPELVEKPDIDGLQKALGDVVAHNEKAGDMDERFADAKATSAKLSSIAGEFSKFIDFDGINAVIAKMPKLEKKSVEEAQKALTDANYQLAKFEGYNTALVAYEAWIAKGKIASEEAEKTDASVKSIEQEKKDLIAKANMPDGFSFNEGAVYYNGFPFDSNQMSSSAKYIAALKLGELSLGEVKSIHFDASFLDKNSLNDIMEWAKERDLQLLIERPDFDGGEIKYDVI